MLRLLIFTGFIGLTGFMLSGCYPGGAEFTEDLDVVYTDHDPEYDFVAQNTYSMPDKIVVGFEVSITGDTTIEYMKDVYAQPILQRIDDNMTAKGWTKVDISQGPDIILTPAGLSSTYFFYDYWYCWYYCGWYGGWGWYYPPYVTVSSLTTGTLVMTMADPNVDSAINRSPAAWVCGINGILTYTYSIDRILGGIDQAFKQSPYLQTN